VLKPPASPVETTDIKKSLDGIDPERRGHWEGSTWVVPRKVQHYSTTIMELGSSTGAPMAKDLEAMLQAYERGDVKEDSGFCAAWIRTHREDISTLWARLDAMVADKKARDQSQPQQPGKKAESLGTAEQQLDRFYKNVGVCDIELQCGHWISSIGVSVEGLLRGRKEVWCTMCATATPADKVIPQLKLEKVRK